MTDKIWRSDFSSLNFYYLWLLLQKNLLQKYLKKLFHFFEQTSYKNKNEWITFLRIYEFYGLSMNVILF